MFRKNINNKFNTNYCLKFKLILKYNSNFISEEKIISVYIKQLNIKAENIVLTCKKIYIHEYVQEPKIFK